MSHELGIPSIVTARLASYTGLAVAAATGGMATSSAHADTYTGQSVSSFTVDFSSSNNFTWSDTRQNQHFMTTADGFKIKAFIWGSQLYGESYHSRGAGFNVPLSVLDSVGEVKWFKAGTGSRLVSYGQNAEVYNFGIEWSYGWTANSNWGQTNLVEGERAFVGFSVNQTPNGGPELNGFIEYQITAHANGISLEVFSWAYNLGSPITMPANGGGGGAVPGLGGIAALACGAAGVRRSRHRAA